MTEYASDPAKTAREHPGECGPKSRSIACDPEEHQGNQDRPEKVDLPLHRERPEVLHRAQRLVPGQIVDGIERQAPVHHVEARGHDLLDRVRPARLGQPDGGCQRDRHQNEAGGGQQALGESSPECRECDVAMCARLPDQRFGDQEPRNDEEDVHPAGDATEPDVIDGHQGCGHRPKTLDLGPELALLARDVQDWMVSR